MKLLLLEDRDLPVVRGAVLVRTGTLLDPPAKAGLAELAGMVLRTGGTRERTGDQIEERLESIAATVETRVDLTSVMVRFECLTEHAEEVLGLVKELVVAPQFPEGQVEAARTRMALNVSRRNRDGARILAREFSALVYGRSSPYGWMVEYDHLDNISRDDLRAFHKQYFYPGNVLLAIQGDFAAASMRGLVEALFGGWSASAPSRPAFPKPDAKAAPGVYLAEKADLNQSFLAVGHLGGRLDEPDSAALAVLAELLGGGFRSRLYQRLRARLGFSVPISASWSSELSHPGLFLVSGSTALNATTETLELVLEEIERIRAAPLPPEELKLAKERVLHAFVFDLEQPGRLPERIMMAEYHGYPRDFLTRYQKAVEAVTPADVLKAAQARIRPRELTIVVTGNPARFGKKLTELKLAVNKIDLAIPPPRPRAETADAASRAKGRELLRRVQEALGGAERLGGVRDYTQTGDAVITGPGSPMKVRQMERWVEPSHFRQDQNLPFGRISVYSSGKGGWLHSQQGVSIALPSAVLKQVQEELFRNHFRLYLSDQRGERAVAALAPDRVEISDKQGNLVRITIDTATGLPAVLSYHAVQTSGPGLPVEERIEEWKEINGLKIPWRITIIQAGEVYAELRIQDFKWNTGLNAADLARIE